MTLHSDHDASHGDLSPGERRAYQSADRETPIDPREEERTVQYLRARGVFGAPAKAGMRTGAGTRRRVWRATAIAGAAAAAVLAALMQWTPSRRAAAVPPQTATRLSESTAVAAPPVQGAPQPSRKSSLLVWY